VRAANTGVSAFINPLGEVVERVHNQDGKDTFIMGGVTSPVSIAKEPTLFSKGGWLFPYLCLTLFMILSLRRPKNTVGPPRPVAEGSHGLLRLRQESESWQILAMAIFLLFFSGCVRLQGGAFAAKKDASGEAKVKEVSFDSDHWLGKQKPSGKVET
jgi:hypothetical protein